MRRFFNFLLGAFSGALVGAVTVMLLTPISGEELRTQARDRLGGVIEEMRAAAEAERQRLEAQLEALKRGEISVEE